MPITAKQLAKELGLSEAAVSMALNNKSGVSTKTRRRVIKAAQEMGYNFSRIKEKQERLGSVHVVFYRTHNAILSYAPIFDELYDGIRSVCQKSHVISHVIHFYEKTDDLEMYFGDIRTSDCCGIILVGTELRKEICLRFLSLGLPVVLLDTYFDSVSCNCILINNQQGAYMATDFLISRYHAQPGYLKSSYSIPNFEERRNGYFRAIKENGMSSSRSIIHELAPSIEDATADMLAVIDNHDPLARCYFADNDMIAIGAIKALKARGYKIPDDVAIIGFDNIAESRIIEPALTTMDVPRFSIGETAAEVLLSQIRSADLYYRKIEISTSMELRGSH